MATTNQLLVSKTFGDKMKFLVTSEDSNEKLLKLEITCEPGAQGPPLHYHPVQEERFEVVKGKLGLSCDGKEMILNPGEKFTVPPNSAHKWWNATQDEMVTRVELTPALKTEFFLESIYSLDVQGKIGKKGIPGPLQFAAILNECYGELFVVGPPIPAQKFMAKVVGRFAKLLGYKGYIPFPKPGL